MKLLEIHNEIGRVPQSMNKRYPYPLHQALHAGSPSTVIARIIAPEHGFIVNQFFGGGGNSQELSTNCEKEATAIVKYYAVVFLVRQDPLG